MRNRGPFATARCVLRHGDEILLAVHSSFWARREQRWGLPGGRVERGEHPHEAARRELREELTLHLPSLTPVGAFRYKGAEHMIYTAEIDERITDYDQMELLDLRWFSYPEIVALAEAAKLHAGYEHLAVQQALAASAS